MFWILLFLALFLWVFWMPTIVAVMNQHPSAVMIFLINLFFGWTFIGWLIAMIWARNPKPPAFLTRQPVVVNNIYYDGVAKNETDKT